MCVNKNCSTINMTDIIQDMENVHTGAIPQSYMPYASTELTREHIEYARNYLNETEEVRNKSLRRIKRFIKGELDVFSELDDILLIGFLRSRRFNFKKTCSMMKKAAETLTTHRHYINRVDTEIMSRVIASKAVNFLPYRDAKGRAICLLVAENWDPDDLTFEDMLFSSLVATFACAENPLNQVAGYVAILDCKNVSFRQFSEMSIWFRIVLQSLQTCCPISVKEIHLINVPTLVLWGWSLIQPFLNEEVKKKITFHDSSNWEKLYEKIPPCILPEEVGGQLGAYSFEHWASDIPMIKKHFFDQFHKCLTE